MLVSGFPLYITLYRTRLWTRKEHNAQFFQKTVLAKELQKLALFI